MRMLHACLDDLARRIDPAVEDALWARWRTFLDGAWRADTFAPQRAAVAAPGRVWPAISVNAALDDREAMLLSQLGGCADSLGAGNGGLLAIRANYGTPILPSLFGADIVRMADELNTLPTSRAIPGGMDGIKALVERGVPDVRGGLGGQVLDAGAYFVEQLQPYPHLARYVHIYHPDLQGPMDVCEMLWGSDIFVDSYDAPELLHALLEVVTATYIAFLRAWNAIVPFRDDGVEVHWGMLHRGHLMLRDDSAMNFSPDGYTEFFAPYEQRLLDTFGGGAIHFCGRGDHFIPHATALRGLTAINMSQPELNDMAVIYRHTVDRGLHLLGLPRHAADAATHAGRPLRGLAHLA